MKSVILCEQDLEQWENNGNSSICGSGGDGGGEKKEKKYRKMGKTRTYGAHIHGWTRPNGKMN